MARLRRPLEELNVRRLLVVAPNWVGDVVLATPTLAALRQHYPDARITLLLRGHLTEVVAGGGWHDDEIHWPAGRGAQREWRHVDLVRRLRSERFDAALLLTNSFRAAGVVALARIPRRIGYARDGRSALLTDRLRPLKKDGRFVPSSVVLSYAKLAERMGAAVVHRKLSLGVTQAQESAGRDLMKHYGVEPRGYIVINPGAAFGAAKCWLPERFAESAVELQREFGMSSLVVGAASEAPLVRRIAELAGPSANACLEPGTTLGSLKPLIRDAALLLCNDTGPRHYGVAFETPTITVFGPTDPAWTETETTCELRLQVLPACGPCQLRVCPLDHRCMTAVGVDMVLHAARRLLRFAEAEEPAIGVDER